MKKNIKSLFILASLPALSLMTSCRSETEVRNITSGRAPVKFNLTGSSFDDDTSKPSALQASVKSTPINAVTHSHIAMVDPSTQAEILVESDSGILKNGAQASVGGGAMAAVAGDPFGVGISFRTIAYRASDGSYQAHQDYIVGQTSVPMMLDSGVAYNIVAYSYGTSTLPAISSGEQANISSAVVNYDNANPDFMYQKLALTPDGNITNTLNLNLRHKLSLITTTLDVTNLGMGTITSISNAKIQPHSTTGTFALSTGNITRGATNANVPVVFAGPFPSNTATSAPVWVNAQANASDDNNPSNVGRLTADITVGGSLRSLTIPSFAITPERKQNITVNFKTCGAYIGANTNPANFKAFMCHNLGADQTVNGFSPVREIHGAKYQWGAVASQTDRYVSQAVDQSTPGPVSSGFNYNATPLGTFANPCPTGYRVPSSTEWGYVLTNNPQIRRVGTWNSDSANFGSGIYFGANGKETLFLPAAGWRNTGISGRGSWGLYWSSTLYNGYGVRLGFTSNTLTSVDGLERNAAAPVRCMAN
ncbi:uncharacterized protein (TIGR02145 family) [Elizabethkingia sp. YR214]|uniref:fimbrillin family protein n=1 Tax=Elizabethkingia sp. YR214 TaxID=2135667 RepID=UPI000D316738|nr:fimbrillin family protein [Elizabethkingia sp. YR214]PUB30783.1 uncharacterized protein (TIGR02145 family) [Elizabethkingia sp. YR214]